MKAMLERLRERLRAEAGPFESRAYVDTGPIAEKAWAAAAGLGALGQEHLPAPPRARLLVLPRRDRDRPRPARRRAARRHVRHLHRLPRRLPDRGLPRAVRARRHALHQLPDDRGEGRDPGGAARGRGPPRLRLRHLPGRVPVEPQAAPPRRRRPSSRGRAPRRPTSPELAGLDEEAFRERFRRSPLKRAKRRGLLRNVAVALGNAGDAGAPRRVLERLAGDEDPLVREHAPGGCGGSTSASVQPQALLELDLVARAGRELDLLAAGREHRGAARGAADEAALERALAAVGDRADDAPAAAAPPAIFASLPLLDPAVTSNPVASMRKVFPSTRTGRTRPRAAPCPARAPSARP